MSEAEKLAEAIRQTISAHKETVSVFDALRGAQCAAWIPRA